jgi:hypothetical protein
LATLSTCASSSTGYLGLFLTSTGMIR